MQHPGYLIIISIIIIIIIVIIILGALLTAAHGTRCHAGGRVSTSTGRPMLSEGGGDAGSTGDDAAPESFEFESLPFPALGSSKTWIVGRNQEESSE
jgi:hypothetical protein